jgi:hypothetical protein
MADDILAQFRRTPSAGSRTGVTTDGPDEYCAFATKDKVHRLRIRCAAALTHSPGYNILLDIVYDGHHGTHFVLVYTTLAVLVRGKNLQKIIFAIENGMGDYIQEFDPKRWTKPIDLEAPFIESIEVKATPNNSTNEDTVH